MNFCTNCKHRSKHHFGDYCRHPSLGELNVVTGEPTTEPCYIVRDSRWEHSIFKNRGKCGPEGTLFEPTDKTLLQKIIGIFKK